MEETNDNGQASSLAMTLAGLGVAVVFEALTVLATHDKPVRAVSPWQDDPYDVALSHAQFAVPMLATVIALRLLAWRAPGGQDRARQVVRATGMMTALIGLTLALEWAAVAVGAHARAWGPWTWVLIGGLAVTSLLAGAEAALLARERRPQDAAGRWRHDWLDDIITACGRVPALRRAATHAAAWLRRHAAAGFAALSVLVAAGITGGLAVSEAWTNPLLVAWALIVEMTGYFAFFMICNAVAGFVARPPRPRTRRVAEASAVAGGAAVQVAVAFRAELWTVIGVGSAKSVPALVALTLGAGLATSLATAGLLALRAHMFSRLWRTGLYAHYSRRLRQQVLVGPLPRHVGLIMDGNRRWARQAGLASPSLGHRAGAEHAEQMLSWCEAAGIKEVTVFICSTENLSRRADAEVAYLMRVIEEVIAARLARPGSGWQVHVAGLLDVLPDSTARALKDAVEQTRACATGAHLTLAIGYGGRQEIVDAVRDLLAEAATAGTSMAGLAERLTADDITAHLYTVGRPDPDLVIRTSGEQRMSNFLLWQSTYSELYFCEAYWPAFREIDFLRALRSYAARKRRFGS